MLNKICFALVSITSPVVAFAQPSGALGGTTTFFQNLDILITTYLMPIVFTLALLMFFWGVVKYIRSEGQGKEDGRRIMVWGIIALFVMSSIWGIIFFLRREFGISDAGSIFVPSITTTGVIN